MRQTIIYLTICVLAIGVTTSCGNSSKEGNSEGDKKDSVEAKKEVAPTKSAEDYGMELADARCKRETAEKEGKPLEVRDWETKLMALEKEFDNKYKDDKEAETTLRQTFKYWILKCPAAKDLYEEADENLDPDSTYSN